MTRLIQQGITTSGSAGNAGATVTIVVAANAPVLDLEQEFYCTVHGNAMGNTITVNDAPSAVVKIYEPSHGRASSETVRFRSAVGFDGISQATLESSSWQIQLRWLMLIHTPYP